MALRVLLADESSTIKRVMQLALQDFAVEVKSVHAGVDVLEVAKTFKPEVIFADVLLQKRNGYDVCAELKADPATKAVPVILMWSSFMELDQALFQKSGANGKLEKPFDVDTIRTLVKDNVARLRDDQLSEYLKFPSNISAPLIEEESQKKQTQATAQPPAAPQIPQAPPPTPVSMESLPKDESSVVSLGTMPTQPSMVSLPPIPNVDDDDIGTDFQLSDLTSTKRMPTPPIPAPGLADSDDDEWVKQDISKFTLDLTPVKLEGEDAAISFDVHHGSIEGEKYLTATSFSNEPNTMINLSEPPPERTKVEEIPFPDFDRLQSTEAHIPVKEIEFTPEPSLEAPTSASKLDLNRQLSAAELEKIIRAQSKEVIEQVVRKVVPEIATQLIRDEIKRLIAEGP